MKIIIHFLSILFVTSLSLQGQDFQEEQVDTDAKKIVSAENLRGEDTLSSIENSPVNKKAKKENQSKLIQKADYYFDKMWYAEAAKYYEMALDRYPNDLSFKIIEKAGDSHYFNTNMERAYHWYNMLYEDYEDEMTSNNYFKYAHALKGNGKYALSKRVMRIYQRQIEKEDVENKKTSSYLDEQEKKLDNILSLKPEMEIKNLAINSEFSEFSPVYVDSIQLVYASSKDSSFLQTRKYKWNDQPFLDLYIGKINERNRELEGSRKLSKAINSKYHEASVAFSPDGNTIYFTRNNTKGKKAIFGSKDINYLKIYRSNLENGEWSEPEALPFNSDDFSTGHPALSPDGRKMYFVSDRPGTIGGTDIFYVTIHEDGTFSDPINLGPEINTPGREMFPFINDKKLYFSSDGHVGLGGLDIFQTPYSDKGFGITENLGQPINSPLDDFSYIVREDSQEGYFASNRKGGKGDDDIYSFKKLVPEEVIENLNALSGVVTEIVTGDYMPSTLVELLDENGKKLKEVLTEDDGTFLFDDLDGNTNYIITAKNDGYFKENRKISTKENELVNTDIVLRRMKEMVVVEDEVEKLKKDREITTEENEPDSAEVALKKMKEMIVVENDVKKLKTEMIYFDFDKSFIREDASQELDKLVEVMNTYEDMVIKIESHTDSRGDASYNKYLSNRRAQSTREYLIKQGIDPSRIESAVGYGEERPINECVDGVRCARQQHQANRRSEFIIVNM